MLESRWLSALISLCGAARTAPTRASDAGRRWRGEETPSPPSDGGEGRGEEGRCVRLPLSSVLSPLLRRGERKKKRDRDNFNLRMLQELLCMLARIMQKRTTPIDTNSVSENP